MALKNLPQDQSMTSFEKNIQAVVKELYAAIKKKDIQHISELVSSFLVQLQRQFLLAVMNL
jgi:hypothetical protein